MQNLDKANETLILQLLTKHDERMERIEETLEEVKKLGSAIILENTDASALQNKKKRPSSKKQK
jgi:hypothetical protein